MPPSISKQTPRPVARTGTGRVAQPPRVVQEALSGWPSEDEGVKMVLYGSPGSGKTTLWATFEKPILALVISGGARPGELRSIDTPELREVIEPKVIVDSAQIPMLLEGIHNYRTVVVDHATGLQDLLIKEILGLDRVPVQKSWGLMTREQYGQLGVKCKELMRPLFDHTCNVVVVAQERSFKEDDTPVGVPYIGPALTPSVAGWLNQAADYICEMFVREEVVERPSKGPAGKSRIRTGKKEHCLRIQCPEVYITKFRAPRFKELPPEIVDPSYEKIMALING
jgi:hypothetical protein